MARRIIRMRSPRRFVSFKVSEEFFNKVDQERKRFFERTGISLTQPVMSNLILKNTELDFLGKDDLFGRAKKKFNGTRKIKRIKKR